jgi:opacity protein-like surface antigen
MKKIILTLLLSAVPAADLYAAAAEDSKIFTPFFDMTLTEAGYLPSEGNIFSGGNINTQVGLLSKITQKDHLFALYNFNYSGPGFAPQDSRQFTDRSMSHGFNFEYRRFLTDSLRIRPGVAFATEYRRTGANEAWKNGLYNMNSVGGQLAADYSLNAEKNGYVTAQALFRNVEFPNYTDLLSEFRNPSQNNIASINGGLQDQAMTQLSLRPNWGNFFGGVTYTLQNYKNQKVVESDGVYGDTKQKDKTTALDFGFHQRLWIFELYPMVSYTMHTSNQNFMLYKSLNDTSPQFSAGYYDYKELAFSVPLDLNITSRWAIGGSINMTKRDYDKRKARDAANNFTGSTQSNTMSTLTGSIRKRINDVAMVRLFYSLVVASSNNKFEQYIPYNYTGNSFGVSYQLSY